MGTMGHSLSEVRQGRAWFEQHRPLVMRVVRRLGSRARLAEREHLLSAGYLGLCDARQRYDPSRGLPFAAYATVRIRGAVLDELRAADPLSRRDRVFMTFAARYESQLTQSEPNRTSLEQLAEVSGIPEEALDRARQRALGVTVWDPSELDSLPAHTLWSDPPDLDRQLDLQQRLRDLVVALRELPPRERLVIGFHYEAGVKFNEIAQLFGVTPSRISQLLARALRRLADGLKDA